MNIIILLGKGLSIIFWASVLYNTQIPFDSPVGPIFSLSAPVILIIHVFEAFFFIRQFKGRVQNLSGHALAVLAFGVFHILEVRKTCNEAAASGVAH